MRNAQRILAISGAVLVAMFVVACGGDSDEDQITEVIQTSVKSTDPADCTKLQTAQFLQQTEFAVGPDALKQCQDNAANTADNPDSVDVKDIKVDGTNATANVTFHGGTFDGSTITVALIKDGDQWKLDKITAIPTFDLQAFIRNFSDQLIAQGKTPQSVISCLTNAISKVGPDQLKQVLISGDSSQLTALFAPCRT
jgi:hypothetical protein